MIDYFNWSQPNTYKLSFWAFFPISLLEVEAKLHASHGVFLKRVYVAFSYSTPTFPWTITIVIRGISCYINWVVSFNLFFTQGTDPSAYSLLSISSFSCSQHKNNVGSGKINIFMWCLKIGNDAFLLFSY